MVQSYVRVSLIASSRASWSRKLVIYHDGRGLSRSLLGRLMRHVGWFALELILQLVEKVPREALGSKICTWVGCSSRSSVPILCHFKTGTHLSPPPEQAVRLGSSHVSSRGSSGVSCRLHGGSQAVVGSGGGQQLQGERVDVPKARTVATILSWGLSVAEH